MFHFSLVELISTAGYLGMFFIVFAESGLFFGFFLPGDSLLFTAGFVASQQLLNIWLLLPLLAIAAIGGDSVGYWMGRYFGTWLEGQKDSFFFKKRHLLKAQSFYESHGSKTIFLARFIPIVRTFAPIVAGMARMRYTTFLSFNVFGGLFWVTTMLLLGYFLGSAIPNVDRYLLPIVAIIIVISILPAWIHYLQEKTGEEKAAKGFSFWFRLKLLFAKIIGR